MTRITMILAVLLTALSASAAETQPAEDFDGSYAITYPSVGFNLHLCVNGQCAYVNVPAVGDQVTPADVDELHLAVSDACYDGLDAWICDWLVDPVVDAIVTWAVAVANQLPETAEVTVDPDPIMFLWWSTGLHDSAWHVTSAVQDPVTLAFTGEVLEDDFNALLDNNDNDNNGNVLAVGLAIGQGFAGNGIACLPAGAAVIAANADRDASFALEGGYVADVELACLITDGQHLALVNLGVMEAAAFEGERQ
jgi:hypothetical protein